MTLLTSSCTRTAAAIAAGDLACSSLCWLVEEPSPLQKSMDKGTHNAHMLNMYVQTCGNCKCLNRWPFEIHVHAHVLYIQVRPSISIVHET